MKKTAIALFAAVFLLQSCNFGGSVESRVEELIREKQFKKAEALILEQEETTGLPPKYRILLAKVYFAWGKYPKALKTLYSMNGNIYGKDRKNYISLLIEIADSAYAKGEKRLAIYALERVIQFDPLYNLGHRFKILGDYYYKKGDCKKAVENYENYISMGGGDLKDVAAPYAKCLYEVGRYQDALEVINSADPKFVERDWIVGNSLFQIGKMYYETEIYDSAIAYFKRVLDFNKPYTIMDDALFYLGLSYEQIGEFDKAIETYEKLIVFYKRSPFAARARDRLNILTR